MYENDKKYRTIACFFCQNSVTNAWYKRTCVFYFNRNYLIELNLLLVKEGLEGNNGLKITKTVLKHEN